MDFSFVIILIWMESEQNWNFSRNEALHDLIEKLHDSHILPLDCVFEPAEIEMQSNEEIQNQNSNKTWVLNIG